VPRFTVTLDDAAVVLGDFRIEKVAAQCLEAFVRAFLVRSRAHYMALKSVDQGNKDLRFPQTCP
jgi:hypothetical protein